ncbi:transcriptional regulator [Sphingobium yanoikuyae]|uniref:ROK family transcriptional regulator n=1 Tax=Sphingobium yanoikuyae TaxID=13690 RepID=A0A3G2UY97_SPHYA|nr:ROK family transcriptional regulator [Sphingobium yanoikuyae]AYO80066.1 ROK family transcriptional regulator [Sphingobium yanoikuyae]KZC81104.1 transcriptional regulator [Sphingobium yanoikuyae]
MNKRGSNAVGVRRYNERLILATVRRLNGASKADLSRITGLSPQAAVRIVESLADEGRLIKAGKRTGGMGQPSIIYRINGGSGCTIGAEIGRDRLVCTMLDFDGRIIACESTTTSYPSPASAVELIQCFARKHMPKLREEQREGFLGFGIAMPWFIGEWREEAGIAAQQAAAWAAPGLEEFFQKELDGPVIFENDGNAGALAELMSGSAAGLTNFLYVHIGSFVGGGLILNGEIKRGKNGNAGALASMPIPQGSNIDFLLHAASLYQMTTSATETKADWEGWMRRCADALAFIIISANSLLDLDAVVIGGGLSQEQLHNLVSGIQGNIRRAAPRDFFCPELKIGENGGNAPAIGAALLPLFSTYAPNLISLLKSDATLAEVDP